MLYRWRWIRSERRQSLQCDLGDLWSRFFAPKEVRSKVLCDIKVDGGKGRLGKMWASAIDGCNDGRVRGTHMHLRGFHAEKRPSEVWVQRSELRARKRLPALNLVTRCRASRRWCRQSNPSAPCTRTLACSTVRKHGAGYLYGHLGRAYFVAKVFRPQAGRPPGKGRQSGGNCGACCHAEARRSQPTCQVAKERVRGTPWGTAASIPRNLLMNCLYNSFMPQLLEGLAHQAQGNALSYSLPRSCLHF